VITKQIIKNENVPVAIILDYNEYLELEKFKEDYNDYISGIETLQKNNNWTNHEDMLKLLEVKD